MGGIQWNQIAANVITSVPSQKSGIESPETATTRPA